MGKKAPPPPDYTAAAEATAESNQQAMRDQTYANRVNQYNPWGNLTFDSYQDVDPATGEAVTRWNQNQTLTPELQAALDAQISLQRGRSELGAGMMGDLQSDYGTRMDFDQFGNPIQLGPQERMTGAGEGINQGVNIGSLPRYNREQLQYNMNFQDPGLQRQNLEQDLDYSGAPQVGSPEWTRAQAEESVYNRGASRLDPQMADAAEALDVQLRSQGLSPGDEAYDKKMRNFDFAKTDAYDALSATAMREGANQAQSMFGMQSAYRDQATGEEDRMKQFRNMALSGQFGMDAQRQAQLFDITKGQADFGNQAKLSQMGQDLQARLGEGGMRAALAALQNQSQQQGWNQRMQQTGYNTDQAYRENALANALRTQGMDEASQQRAYRLNEVNALLGGQQVSAPQFNNYNQQGYAGGTDYMGAADTGYQAQLGQFGANNAMWNSLIGGGAQLGAGLASGGFFSDRRLKTNVAKIGEINGTNWYEFDYLWGEHAVGVMADEVPHAAFIHPSGFLMVDYSKV